MNTGNENSSRDCSVRKDNNIMKVKGRRKRMPRDSPFQRSSAYRGVTRHRWTGRYEAHLWDKNCWNESQSKKGKQVYLGAYDNEAAAARAYDLAALKYWGHNTVLNFPVPTYQEELKEMEGQSREEYVGSLRRKSSGFSRGVSKYRGVARHHHNGRWEARIGRVFGNKYLYLGTYATQEEAAIAYDIAAIEHRGLNAVTNFDMSRYMKCLQPSSEEDSSCLTMSSICLSIPDALKQSFHRQQQLQQQRQEEESMSTNSAGHFPAAASASKIGLLLQSPQSKEILDRTSASSGSSSSSSAPRPGCCFPENIQTYFECQENAGFTDEEYVIFGDLGVLVSPIF